MIECLKANKRQLSSRCHQRVFKLQEVEMVDPELDYQLMKVCKHMIRVGPVKSLGKKNQYNAQLYFTVIFSFTVNVCVFFLSVSVQSRREKIFFSV